MSQRDQHIPYTLLDKREPAKVRAAILARISDPSAKAEDMEDQVRQCEKFIATMGWPPTSPRHIYTEARSGYRNVQRPILEELLAACAKKEIDVIVVREFQRIDRKTLRRHHTIVEAQKFGVEFRYANLPEQGGKMKEDKESHIYRTLVEEMGEMEHDIIVERLTSYKDQRFEHGYPDGGSNGPLYGYAPGERRIGERWQAEGLALVGARQGQSRDCEVTLRNC